MKTQNKKTDENISRLEKLIQESKQDIHDIV